MDGLHHTHHRTRLGGIPRPARERDGATGPGEGAGDDLAALVTAGLGFEIVYDGSRDECPCCKGGLAAAA